MIRNGQVGMCVKRSGHGPSQGCLPNRTWTYRFPHPKPQAQEEAMDNNPNVWRLPPETPTRGAHFPQPPQPPQFCFLLPFLQTLISPCFSSSSNPNPNSSSHLHSDSHMLPESMINPRPSTDYSSHHRLLEILKPSDANLLLLGKLGFTFTSTVLITSISKRGTSRGFSLRY